MAPTNDEPSDNLTESHQTAPDGSGQPEIPDETSGKALVKVPDLYEQMAKTWKLPIDDLVLLVNAPPKTPVTEGMAIRILAASKQYGIPIPGFNLIPTGTGGYTLYINAAGIQFRLATDPRELESVTSAIEHMPDLEKEKDYICVKATIRMKDGSVAEDFGVSEWPATGKDGQMRLGDLVMKLTTKAIRRASTRLVGTTLPIYDEDYYAYIAGPGKDVMDADYRIIKPKARPEKPTNIAELCVMALDLDPELNATKLAEIMGVNAITELDIEKTWEKIQDDYQKV